MSRSASVNWAGSWAANTSTLTTYRRSSPHVIGLPQRSHEKCCIPPTSASRSGRWGEDRTDSASLPSIAGREPIVLVNPLYPSVAGFAGRVKRNLPCLTVLRNPPAPACGSRFATLASGDARGGRHARPGLQRGDDPGRAARTGARPALVLRRLAY